MKLAYTAVLMTATRDAMGIALTLPILPDLLRDVSAADHLGWRFGLFLSIYALMQFLCAPALGALSDRYGRRRVLLLSLQSCARFRHRQLRGPSPSDGGR